MHAHHLVIAALFLEFAIILATGYMGMRWHKGRRAYMEKVL